MSSWAEEAAKGIESLRKELGSRELPRGGAKPALRAYEALLTIRPRLDRLPPEIAQAVASAWMGDAYTYFLDDDEFVYANFRPTPAGLVQAVGFIERTCQGGAINPAVASALVHAASSPHVDEQEMLDVLAQLQAPDALRQDAQKAIAFGMTNYGSALALEFLTSSIHRSSAAILLDALRRAGVHRYSIHDDRRAYEKRVHQLATLFEVARENYSEQDVEAMFSEEGIMRFPADGRPFNSNLEGLLLQLMKQRIQPLDRLESQFARLSRVRPHNLALEMAASVRSYDVFISHSSADKELARRLGSALKSRDMAVWFDEWIMKPGDVLSRQIADGIDRCTYFVLLMSPSSLSRDWVRYELDLAVTKQVSANGRFLIPVVIDEAQPPPAIRHLLYRRVPSSIAGANLADALQLDNRYPGPSI